MNLGPGTIIDISMFLIIFLSTIFGARKGLALTMISFMQWFGCLVMGILLCNVVKGFLIDYTTLDASIQGYLLESMAGSTESSSAYQAMPDLFGQWVNETTETFLTETAASITSVMLTVISFLLIVFGIKFIGFMATRIFSKKYHHGTIGFFDGFMGFIFGGIRGILFVFLGFTLLVPVLGLIWPEMSKSIMDAMNDSTLASYLYNDNILLILIRDSFS